jgi:LysM repeat protein
MHTRKITAIFLLLSMTLAMHAQRVDTAATRAYIQQYKDIAIEEMNRAGIPASITLAQGIHESGLGKSYLAVNTNNHFGIKCHENWTGKTFKYSDDAPDECFRAYDNPAQSYRDHSDFLRNRTRYAALFQLDKTDYKAWAYGLKKAGYATNPRYPEILIRTIEDFQLNLLDQGQTPSYMNNTVPVVVENVDGQEIIDIDEPGHEGISNSEIIETENENANMQEDLTDAEPVSADGEQKIVRVNRRKAVLIGDGETLELIGSILKIPTADLLAYNDISDPSVIKGGHLLFIQNKRRRNPEKTYAVKTGDNMWIISQEKGIQLNALLRHNRMVAGEEPAVAETIYLKGTAKVRPKLRMTAVPDAEGINGGAMSADAGQTIAPSASAKPEAMETIYAQRPEDDAKNDMIADVETTPAAPVSAAAAPAYPPVASPAAPAQSAASMPSASLAEAASGTQEKTVYPSVIDYNSLPKSTTGYHTVVKGDTMYNICKRYGITMAQLTEWNNLPDQSVKLGQVLKIQP